MDREYRFYEYLDSILVYFYCEFFIGQLVSNERSTVLGREKYIYKKQNISSIKERLDRNVIQADWLRISISRVSICFCFECVIGRWEFQRKYEINFIEFLYNDISYDFSRDWEGSKLQCVVENFGYRKAREVDKSEC